jgi:hypothetical protein
MPRAPFPMPDALDGPAVLVQMTTKQLELVGKALAAVNCNIQPVLTDAQREELALLAGCCRSAAADPGAPGDIHGFCL